MAFLSRTILVVVLYACVTSAQTQDITIILPTTDTATNNPDSSGKPLVLNRAPENTKSIWGTAFLNLAVPGAGHLYLKDKKKAAAYLAADATLWLGFIFTYSSSQRQYDDAITYARTYAHTQSTRNSSDGYWGDIATYLSSDNYNDTIAFYRTFEDQYLGTDSWSWDAEENQDTYEEIRSTAGNWKTASQIIVGALVLNRVVAFIDGRISAQKFNNAQMKIIPTMSLDSKEVGAVLLVSF